MTDHLSHQGHSGYHAPEARPVLRLLALTAVALGVLVLAAAAFALSYQGIHVVAREAGVSARLARVYPVIIDAMVVIAGAAVLALRGGGLVSRCYAWLSLLLLIAAGAGADVLHSTATKLPHKPAAITAAVLPWALVLIGFWLLMAIIRHTRLHRTTATTGRPVAGNQRPGSGQPAQYRPAGPPPIPVLAQSPLPQSPVPAQGPAPAQAPALLTSAPPAAAAAPIITEPPTQSAPAQPETARPEVAQAEKPEPETAQAEVAKPEVAEAAGAEPEVAQPKVAAPPTGQLVAAQPQTVTEPGPEEPAPSPVPAFHRVWSSPTPPGEDDQD